MKEIDFMPDWYRTELRRKRRCRRQYVLLAALIAVLAGWSFVAGHRLEQARAEVRSVQDRFESEQEALVRVIRTQSEIAVMQQKQTLLESITPRTTLSAILAELSHTVGENVILSRLTLTNEPIARAAAVSDRAAGTVQIGTSRKEEQSAFSQAPSRTKVVLNGIAARPADAAALISKLEQGGYFEQVAPVYTRARKLKDNDVTEFEIRFYVADYRIIQDTQ